MEAEESSGMPAPLLKIDHERLAPPGLSKLCDYLERPHWAPAQFDIAAAPHQFRIATSSELVAAHGLSEAIMGIKLAPLRSLASAHHRTQATTWLHRSSAEAGRDTGV